MTLGNRIKAARERLQPKPTQEDVAAQMGVTDKAVSGWERDASIPELKKLAKLSKVLKVSALWLLEGTGNPPDPDSLEVQIDRLQPGERAVVRNVIEGFTKQRDSVA